MPRLRGRPDDSVREDVRPLDLSVLCQVRTFNARLDDLQVMHATKDVPA